VCVWCVCVWCVCVVCVCVCGVCVGVCVCVCVVCVSVWCVCVCVHVSMLLTHTQHHKPVTTLPTAPNAPAQSVSATDKLSRIKTNHLLSTAAVKAYRQSPPPPPNPQHCAHALAALLYGIPNARRSKFGRTFPTITQCVRPHNQPP